MGINYEKERKDAVKFGVDRANDASRERAKMLKGIKGTGVNFNY